MPTAPIVVLDGETTGLNRFTDVFWEFAAVRINPDGTRCGLDVFVQHDLAKAAALPEWFRKSVAAALDARPDQTAQVADLERQLAAERSRVTELQEKVAEMQAAARILMGGTP